MTNWQVWVHPAVDEQLETWRDVRTKVDWTIVQLALHGGRTIRVLGTTGSRLHWRRTPVGGKHYYLWWIPGGVCGVNGLSTEDSEGGILIRDLRHHDATGKEPAPVVGNLGDYRLVDLAEVDPRYEDQHGVIDTPLADVDIRLVSGPPGSGKTVALLYAAIDLAKPTIGKESDHEPILYVTYTPGLAEQARDLADGYGVAERVKVTVFSELASDILRSSENDPGNASPGQAFERFMALLDHQNPSDVGPWRRFPKGLWGEVRAYLVGMALPFQWKLESFGDMEPCAILDWELYREIRNRLGGVRLDADAAKRAHHIACLAAEEGLLVEQDRARLVLSALMSYSNSDMSERFRNLSAVIVDEIQDLTLLQVALLSELGRNSANTKRSVPFVFLAAGDESQVVHPSGFDWGVTNNLLRERLGSHPRTFDLQHQRRSPSRLAQLVEDSHRLYNKLPKAVRPQAKVQNRVDGEAESGVLLRWRLGDNPDWDAILEEMQHHPDLAFVDLGDQVRPILEQVPQNHRSYARSIAYTPRTIKGLDRKIVLVWGLEERIRGFPGDLEGNPLALLQTRHAVDDIRVALSRATRMLVIVERNGTDAVEALDLDHEVEIVEWERLREHLNEEDRDLTGFDRVFGYLRTAEESIGRGDYERADEQNRQARQLLHETDDRVLEQQVSDQKRKIEQHLIEVRLAQSLDRAEECLQASDYEAAYEDWTEARGLLAQTDASRLEGRVESVWKQIKPGLHEAANECWRRALAGVREEHWDTAVQGFRRAAEMRRDQGEDKRSEALFCLAERYEKVPPPAGEEGAVALVDFITRYVEILRYTGTGEHEGARRFAEQWLGEVQHSIADREVPYLPWAKAANQVDRWKGRNFLEGEPPQEDVKKAIGILNDLEDLCTGELCKALTLTEMAFIASLLESRAQLLRQRIEKVDG